MSAPTRSRLRDRRSTSGPSRRPIATAGKEVRDQQRADPVRRVGSVLDVDHQRDHGDPRAEPRDQRRAEQEPELRRRAEDLPLARQDQRQSHGRDVSAPGRRADVRERVGEELRSRPASRTVTRIAVGAPKPCSGRTITPSREQRLEERPRVLADVDVEEVARPPARRARSPCVAEHRAEPGAALGVDARGAARARPGRRGSRAQPTAPRWRRRTRACTLFVAGTTSAGATM